MVLWINYTKKCVTPKEKMALYHGNALSLGTNVAAHKSAKYAD